MRRILITIASAAVMLMVPVGAASAEQPANARASCVALITSYEASQLAPGSVGGEVSGLATSGPGLGHFLVGQLAQQHLGSVALCRQAEE